MLAPRVELEPRVRLGDKLRELPGRVRRAKACRLVAAARGRFADRDLCQRVARLDAGVTGRRELRIVRRRYGAAALVELWTEELLKIRLVPDRPETNERVAGVPTGVPRPDRLGEGREVGNPGRHDVRRLAAVRPTWRPRDGEDDLLIVLLRRAHGLVDVVEVVCRI